MTRVKGGTVAKTRRRKVLKQAKGYFGSKHRLFKTAQEQVFHSGAYAYRDRKVNKRNFRKLWITRINAACRENEISYSKFINGLAKAGVTANRKMLSELAIDDKKAFTEFVNLAKAGLAGTVKAAPVIKEGPKTEVKEIVAKPEVKPEVAVEVAKPDYATMTLTKLKELAKEKGLKGYSTMKKEELISIL